MTDSSFVKQKKKRFFVPLKVGSNVLHGSDVLHGAYFYFVTFKRGARFMNRKFSKRREAKLPLIYISGPIYN